SYFLSLDNQKISRKSSEFPGFAGHAPRPFESPPQLPRTAVRKREKGWGEGKRRAIHSETV
ncbi:MAG: hypothetical protein ABR929_15625, partial [Roseiarcus sp.]